MLHRNSALFYLINTQWQSFRYSWGLAEGQDSFDHRHFGDPDSPQSKEYRRHLTTFIEVTKRVGVPLAIILFPTGADLGVTYPYGFLHERVLEVCTEEEVPCIDLRSSLAPYAGEGQSSKLIVNRFDGHPSALVNRIAADLLLERFRDNWVSGMIRRAATRGGVATVPRAGGS